MRPRRHLPPQEREVEQAILRMLGDGDGGAFWAAVERGEPVVERAARGYRPFLPVVAWGEARQIPGDDGPQEFFGVASHGAFFPMAPMSALADLT